MTLHPDHVTPRNPFGPLSAVFRKFRVLFQGLCHAEQSRSIRVSSEWPWSDGSFDCARRLASLRMTWCVSVRLFHQTV